MKKIIIRKTTDNKPKGKLFTPPGKTEVIKKSEQAIRLNKFIANAGICSRREADTLIQQGKILVNNKVITELGTRIHADDEVIYKDQKLTTENKIYLLLNKPKGFVTTMDDPHAPHTVMELIGEACSERIYPVGRLDKDTTGVLLFTNDGELAKKLTHPSFEKKKIYHVFLDHPILPEDIQKLKEGVQLEDGFVAADAISYVDNEDPQQVGIEIHSGKNRIVRRMFASINYRIIRLDRVFFAGLTKKNLPRGKWRFLDNEEINFLKMN